MMAWCLVYENSVGAKITKRLWWNKEGIYKAVVIKDVPEARHRSICVKGEKMVAGRPVATIKCAKIPLDSGDVWVERLSLPDPPPPKRSRRK